MSSRMQSCLQLLRLGVVVTLIAGALALVGATTTAAHAAECTIPDENVQVTVENQSGSNGSTSAWDRFHVTTDLTNLDGLPAGCTATVALDPDLWAGMTATILYLNADGTSSKTPQADTVASMSLDPDTATLTFTLTDFAATHQDVQVQGWVQAQITSQIERGETTPVMATINGTTQQIGTVTGATCTTDCPVPPADWASKWGHDNGDGTGTVTIQTPVVPAAGTDVRVTDTLDTPGQSITGVGWAAGYDCVNDWGNPGIKAADGSCDTGSSYPVSVTTNPDGSFSFTTTQPGEFVRLTLKMTFDPAYDSWKDTATVSFGGQEFTATHTQAAYSAGGGADGTAVTPGLSVVKSAAPTVDANGDGVVGDAGDTIVYSFEVTNTGNTTLSNVVVDDPMLASYNVAVDCPATSLAPGDALTCTSGAYIITPADEEAGRVLNVATASADTNKGDSPESPSNEVEVPTQPTPPSVDTVVVQIDSYRWHGSASVGRRVAAIDDDGKLMPHEDNWMSRSGWGGKHTRKTWQVVSVTVPKSATKAERIAAINAELKDGMKRLRSSRKVPATNARWGNVTMAWVLGETSWPAGPDPQRFWASSQPTR